MPRGADPGRLQDRAVACLGPALLRRAQGAHEPPLLLQLGVNRPPGCHQQTGPLLVG
jgi:hypothetical protein